MLARLDPLTARAEHELSRRTLERNRTLLERRLIAQGIVDSAEAEVAAWSARRFPVW